VSLLEGKVAVVTGASRGIGESIAATFIREGAAVVICGRKQDTLAETAAALPKGPGRVLPVVCHVGRAADIDNLVAVTTSEFGKIDILVNNAATNPWAGPVIDAPLSAWDKTVEVNLRGPLAWSQIAWHQYMKDHSGCSIINIASVGGYKTSSALGVYAILKAALIHMTKQLAAELGPNVRVNALAPAVVRTDFARILWEGDRGDAVARTYPLQRLGEPSDIGEAALYLAAGATWMTGQTLVLDGGGLIAFSTDPE